ncbi:MAG: hypothetical protein AAB552_01810 [Patescibacteria group bacterium]
MDIKKDIQSQGMLSQQSKGGMEVFAASTMKKTERLATALYLVTNFLPDAEPLKLRLRELALELVREASNVRYGTSGVEARVLEDIQTNIGETLTLLELAFISGAISEMNFSILKREYVSLRGAVEIKKVSKESRTDTLLGDSFFGLPFGGEERRALPRVGYSANLPHLAAVDSEAGKFSESTVLSQGHDKGHSEHKMSLKMSDTKAKEKTGNVPVKEKTDKGHSFLSSSQKPNALSTPNEIQKDSRQTRILKLIKDNKEVTIKDITFYFPELSEKTIQRELISLVEANVLKKSGERRWSRYSLVI